jgi:hypothetical protein
MLFTDNNRPKIKNLALSFSSFGLVCLVSFVFLHKFYFWKPISANTVNSSKNPFGYVDTLNKENYTIGGWSCDPDNFDQSVDIQLYLSNYKPSASTPCFKEGSTEFCLAADTKAYLASESAVNNICGGKPNKRYVLNIPTDALDNIAKNFKVFALDIGGLTEEPQVLTSSVGHIFLWGNSGSSDNVTPNSKSTTIRHSLDGIQYLDNKITGWSCNLGSTTPTTINIYVTNFSSGTCKNFTDGTRACLVGSTRADKNSESAVNNICGGSNKRFDYTIPDYLKDNKIHKLYAETYSVGVTQEFEYYKGMARDIYYYNSSERKILLNSTKNPATSLDKYSTNVVLQNCPDLQNNEPYKFSITNSFAPFQKEGVTTPSATDPRFFKMCNSSLETLTNYNLKNLYGLTGQSIDERGVNNFSDPNNTHAAGLYTQPDGTLYLTNIYPHAIGCSGCDTIGGQFTLAPQGYTRFRNSLNGNKDEHIWRKYPNADIEISANVAFPKGVKSGDNRIFSDLVILMYDSNKPRFNTADPSSALWISSRLFYLGVDEPAIPADYVFTIDWGATALPILNANFNSPSPYLIYPQYSHTTSTNLYSDMRKYAFVLTPEKMQSILNYLNSREGTPGYNSDYRDWSVHSVNLTHELNPYGSTVALQNSYLSMFSKDITVAYYKNGSTDDNSFESLTNLINAIMNPLSVWSTDYSNVLKDLVILTSQGTNR